MTDLMGHELQLHVTGELHVGVSRPQGNSEPDCFSSTGSEMLMLGSGPSV